MIAVTMVMAPTAKTMATLIFSTSDILKFQSTRKGVAITTPVGQ